MTRAKIELAYITDPAKRKATFKKRKNGSNIFSLSNFNYASCTFSQCSYMVLGMFVNRFDEKDQ